MQLGSQTISTISQLLHRKGQPQAPPDTDEPSLVIGSFHNAPLSSRMHSHQIQPVVGRRGELDNYYLYLHHPSRRLDLQSTLDLAPISTIHTPELIDNLYLTGVNSDDSAKTSSFLLYMYIPEATADDISTILSKQLEEMQKNGALSPTDNNTSSMTAHPLTDTHHTTYLDDEHISQATNMTSEHLKGVPHAYIVTAPTFSPTTYGLTLLASRQLR